MKDHVRVLLVEDDKNFGSVLKLYLEMHHYLVTWIDDGQKAMLEYESGSFDLCILDVMLPNIDGFTIAREIKKRNQDIPMIFLTAKTLKDDELQGYRIGADDYIKKPFDSEVLLCKIGAILKRHSRNNRSDENQHLFSLGIYNFNAHTRILKSPSSEVQLTPRETELLKLLCLYRNGVLPREKALRSIWGEESYFTTRSMDVFITRLRKYLHDDPGIKIITVHGSGFRLCDEKE